MTEDAVRDRMFEVHLENFERNRMYPPRYRKESTMKAMTLDHVGAIEHARFFMHPHIVPNMIPRVRQEIEDDLLRLKEVKIFLLRQLYEPGLPMPRTKDKGTIPDGNSGS